MNLEHNDSFVYVLKYMYTSQLIVKNANVDRIFDLMFIAKELQLQSLSEGISKMLIDNLTIENVASVYEKANLYDQNELKKACETFIDDNAECLDSLVQLSNRSLGEILRRASFRRNEVKVFELVSEWHKYNNRTDNIDNELLDTVRFELIPDQELIRLANHSNIISEDILFRILRDRLLEVKIKQTTSHITYHTISTAKKTKKDLKAANLLASGSDDKTII